MSLNTKKTKHTLLVSLLLSCLYPIAAILVVAGSSLLIAPAAQAQENYPDPMSAIEAVLNGVGANNPTDPLAKKKLYDHIVGTASGGGASGSVDKWAPSKPNLATVVSLGVVPLVFTVNTSVMSIPVTIKFNGTDETFQSIN